MINPAISVILPFYNAQEFLKEAIESVLNQTFKNFELILINDGSNDKSPAIAESFKSIDNRIKIINQPNKGMAFALNKGIEISSSSIIARMDGDDICHPNRLMMQFEKLKMMPEKSLVSSLVKPFSVNKISEGSERYFNWVNSKISHEQILEGLFKESPLIHPSVMFTKKAFISSGQYLEYKGPEDYDLWLKMAQEGTRFTKIESTLLNYRIHQNNLSRNDMDHYGLNVFKNRQYKFIAENLNTFALTKEKKIVICGAGKDGKKLYNYLKKFNVDIDFFIDISPKKVGTRYQNLNIYPISKIDDNENTFYLCTTGTWASEEKLEELFISLKKSALKDYLII